MNLPIPAFSLEEATILDLFSLRRLENECFGGDAWSMLELAGVLAFPVGVRLKAVIADQTIGFIAGEWESDRKVGWIATLGVLPAFQRRGIAAALLAACEQQLAAPVIKLCVRVDNTAAINLYQIAGYRQVDVRRRYYSDNEDAFVFEKKTTV
jgi:ribosomal-protein-alanine N-acetyltransferase